jgi:hypothetical protein
VGLPWPATYVSFSSAFRECTSSRLLCPVAVCVRRMIASARSTHGAHGAQPFVTEYGHVCAASFVAPIRSHAVPRSLALLFEAGRRAKS